MKPVIRILNLVYTLPTPPFGGYHLRNLSLMNNLSDRVEQTMLCRITEPLTPEQQLFCEQAPFKVKTVLLPRPTPLQQMGKGLSFIPRRYPVIAAGWYFKKMAQALEATIAEEEYDFIVLEGIWLSVYWSVLKESTSRKVLNLYDLEAGLLRRQADNLPHGLNRMLCANGARRMAKLEQKIPQEADLIWTVSEKERRHLLDQSPDMPVYLAPGGVDCDCLKPLPPTLGKEALFVGSLQYLPNADGVNFFVNEILPCLLSLCPEAVFRVVGMRPSPQILALHQPPHLCITGEVDEVDPYYAGCQVCVVPLRSGGGTRLKILEAMALGRPVVSTSIGAEGIEVEHGRNILIADTPGEFALAVNRVLSDQALAASLANEGRLLVEERYAWKCIADTMYERYSKMLREQDSEQQVMEVY